MENLALACQPCNRNKGSDLGSISLNSGKLIRFFDPRNDIWTEHFQIQKNKIKPISEIGKVTEKILKLNSEERVQERLGLIEIGHYPPQDSRLI